MLGSVLMIFRASGLTYSVRETQSIGSVSCSLSFSYSLRIIFLISELPDIKMPHFFH